MKSMIFINNNFFTNASIGWQNPEDMQKTSGFDLSLMNFMGQFKGKGFDDYMLRAEGHVSSNNTGLSSDIVPRTYNLSVFSMLLINI